MPNILDKLRQAASSKQTRILFPEAHDERVLTAAARTAELEIARPVLFGPDAEITRLCSDLGISTELFEFLPQTDDGELAEYAGTYEELRDVSRSTARRILTEELVLGGLLVRLGTVDGMVAGATHPTSEVVAVANGLVGLAPGVNTASSYFLMVFDDETIGENGALLYADCGVNIDPSVNQLADIAVETVDTAEQLFDSQPRVAMLSFSTRGSADHDAAEKVAKAARRAAEQSQTAVVDGELQADVALVPEVAKRKVPDERTITGNANVLIFPDLDAGNIAYKLTERLAGATALGPILQGYAQPVSDLSRGASVEDIVDVTTITAVQSAPDRDGDGEIIQEGLLSREEADLVESESEE